MSSLVGKSTVVPAPAVGRLSLRFSRPDAPFGPPPTRAPILLGVSALVLFFGSLSAWSALAPLAEAAIAPGMVKVEGTRRTVQHLEGGIVREILVRDGDRVEGGQVMARLDDVQADMTLGVARGAVLAARAQAARLEAEFEAVATVQFPADLLASSDARFVEALEYQRRLFESRSAAVRSQVDVLQSRIMQQRAIILSAEAQQRSADTQLRLIRQEEEMVRVLVARGLERIPRLLTLQRTQAQIEGNIEDGRGQVARAMAAIAETEAALRQVIDQRRQEVSTELAETRTRLAEAEERLRGADDVVVRREIVAPESGIVHNLRVHTVGAVIRPGDPVLDIVPARDRLIAEVRVQPGDIEVVVPGLRSELRLPGYKQRRIPPLDGEVVFVAGDATLDERAGVSYFRAHIAFNEAQLASLPEVRLLSGMPVEAQIRTGERSFFRYLLQPLMDSFHRAFREQ